MPYDPTNIDERIAKLKAAYEGAFPGTKAISGYRSPATNLNVGGAKASQHMSGRAMDLMPPPGVDPKAFVQFALDRGVTGLGQYGGGRSYHVDFRPGNNLTAWGPRRSGLEGTTPDFRSLVAAHTASQQAAPPMPPLGATRPMQMPPGTNSGAPSPGGLPQPPHWSNPNTSPTTPPINPGPTPGTSSPSFTQPSVPSIPDSPIPNNPVPEAPKPGGLEGMLGNQDLMGGLSGLAKAFGGGGGGQAPAPPEARAPQIAPSSAGPEVAGRISQIQAQAGPMMQALLAKKPGLLAAQAGLERDPRKRQGLLG